MSAKGKGVKRPMKDADDDNNEVDLFARLSTKDSGAGSESDTTDEEESEYSDLEDEEPSSDEISIDQDMSDSAPGSSTDEEESSEEEEEISVMKIKEKNKKKNDLNNANQIKSKNTKNTKEEEKAVSSVKLKKKSDKIKESNSNVETKAVTPSTPKITVTGPSEYLNDSSDEEDLRNTVGNIPMEWYREYEHIGYNVEGQKIIKPPSGDQLDEFLNKMDNPNYWRTIVDKTTGQNVVLSEQDCEMIRRFRRGKFVDSTYDPYEPWVDSFSWDTMKHPVTNRPADKRSFIPSKWEKLKVGRMVHAIKMGWMKPQSEQKSKQEDEPKYYMLWQTDEQSDIIHKLRGHIPAPKLPLPGHEESYNPPPEYLFTEQEELAWKEKDPEDRRLNFIPQKFSSLRQVPGYDRFINDRFERCLDLYLCPRQRKLRMQVNPEDLLPKLPKPKDLQPFPTYMSLVYKGHEGIVRSISAEPTGQWLVSGSDDQTVRVWEVATGRCMKTIQMGGVVKHVVWNPNPSLSLVAAVIENDVIVMNPMIGDKMVISNTDNLLKSYSEVDDNPNAHITWETQTGREYDLGFRLKITHFKAVGEVSWHGRGDYLAVVIPGGESKAVVIHQLSKRRSQHPFSKSKGIVQCVLFHPTRPFLFVATQRYVRVYNLLKQELTKKLMTNVKWVSSMAVHPGGDNVIVGSYDCRLTWFDLDLSTKPYQTLRHHKKAIRQVCYHRKYPLFASCSDDGSIIICHGRVYNDLLKNPLIVPVKVLRGHVVQGGLGVLSCTFHPTQPWVFSSGSDHTIRLFT